MSNFVDETADLIPNMLYKETSIDTIKTIKTI
jgi:hypothetical protein